MREDVLQSISACYQNRIPRTKAKYYITPEFENLIRVKTEAENNPAAWKTFKQYLRRKYPEYCYNDLTYLGKDSGFFLELFLLPGLSYNSDDRMMMRKAGGTLRQMNIFVSVVGPFFFHYVRESTLVDGKKDSMEFREVHFRDYKVPEMTVAEAVNKFWTKRNYVLLSKDEVREPVPGFFHEEEYAAGEEVPVFRFLFSTADWIKD